MLDYLKQPEIVFILFAIILNVILLVKSKKLFSLIITNMIILCGCVLIILNILDVTLPMVGPFAFEFVIDVVCAIGLLIVILLLYVRDPNEELYKETLNTLDKSVIAYLDKEGNLIKFTQNCYDELKLNYNDNLKEVVSDLFLNNQKIDYQTLLEELKDNEGKEFKLTFSFDNALVKDNEEISLNLQKIAVENAGKLFGYVIVLLENGTKDNSQDGFSLVIDDLEVPYAYFNDDDKNVIYIINKSFRELLGIKGRTVTYSELRRLVFPEDLTSFDKAASEIAEDGTYNYRLKTANGYKIFTEVKVSNNNRITSIITFVETKEDQNISQNEIEDTINQMIQNNLEFAGVIISINGFLKVFNNYGVDVAKELRDKYLGFIKSEVLKQNDLLCKISDIEYLLLFRNPKDVDQIIRDCNNQTSVLLHYELDYNETKIETNNTLGIVYSNESIKTAKDFMHSLDSALAYANTEGYEKPYSIYNYSSKTLRERLTVNNLAKDYSFDKIKISLDNSFLDDEDDL